MIHFILFDDCREHFFPLTFFRPISNIRIGILTIKEKWELALKQKVSIKTEAYLEAKYSSFLEHDNVFINARYVPDNQLIKSIKNLNTNEALFENEVLLAIRTNLKKIDLTTVNHRIQSKFNSICIRHNRDVFSLNAHQIKADFKAITNNKASKNIPRQVYTINSPNIFIGNHTTLHNTSLNASQGPIFIGDNVTLMEYSSIQGPASIFNHTTVKMGAKIYGGTSIGPNCKVGGEIKNSIFFGNSNKGHEGYIGDAVIAEWCNIGANSNCSNMKNNYSNIRQWSYKEKKNVDTNQQFCGLVMGDYSSCAINSAFNTGAIVGTFANVFGNNYPKFIPDFTWGVKSEYQIKKAIQAAKRLMKLKNISLSKENENIIRHVFSLTKPYREDFFSKYNPSIK